jgi:hypothetical protein
LAEAGRPGASTPLAADDMIGSLAARVRELSLRVAQLEGELEAARRRITVYEDFDAQVQDSLSAALRAANQIRERAHVTAQALAEEARAQRPATATELDATRLERDALRRAIDDASANAPSRAAAAPATTFPMSEMRVAATEALRGVFKELVAEIRAAQPSEALAPRPANSPSPIAQPPVFAVPAAQQPSSAPTPPPSFIAPPAPRPVAPPPPPVQPAAAAPPPVSAPPVQQWTAPTLPPAEPAQQPQPVPPPQPYAAPPSSYNAPAPQAAGIVEDVDVAPAAAAPPPPPQPVAAAPTSAPAQPQPLPAPTWTPPATEPIGEVQVVLSPISSFPRLVELERRLQGMSVVRTVYARDFRNGVATLAIGLRHPMTVDEFAAAVTKLEYPRLRIVSTSGYVLELRIDAEASSIA